MAKAEELLAQIEELQTKDLQSPEFQQWHESCKLLLLSTYGEASPIYIDFRNMNFRATWVVGSESDGKQQYANGLNRATATLRNLVENISNESPQNNAGNSIRESALRVIENLCHRFHRVVLQLRTRNRGKTPFVIEDEYDVQYLFNGLLRVYFDDVRAEEPTQSFAGKGSRMDFLMKNEKIVLEIKHTRDTLTEKEIGDEFFSDLHRYEVHLECEHLVFFIYDPRNIIENPGGVETDLNKQCGGLPHTVIIRPKI